MIMIEDSQEWFLRAECHEPLERNVRVPDHSEQSTENSENRKSGKKHIIVGPVKPELTITSE